jgi:hypothetical protein
MRNKPLKLGKRQISDKPTLAESKFVIVLTGAFLLLFSGFYYMLFHFHYPSDMFGTPDLSNNSQIERSGKVVAPPAYRH